MKSVRIDKGRLIPVAFGFAGTFLLFLLYKFLYENLTMYPFIGLGILFSPILPILWTSRTIYEINPVKKIRHEFIWIMGNKIGKPVPYLEIEKVYVNKIKMSQRMTSWGGQTNTARFYEYVGYVKFSDGIKSELVRDRELKFVIEKMKKIAKKLNKELMDNTASSGA